MSDRARWRPVALGLLAVAFCGVLAAPAGAATVGARAADDSSGVAGPGLTLTDSGSGTSIGALAALRAGRSVRLRGLLGRGARGAGVGAHSAAVGIRLHWGTGAITKGARPRFMVRIWLSGTDGYVPICELTSVGSLKLAARPLEFSTTNAQITLRGRLNANVGVQHDRLLCVVNTFAGEYYAYVSFHISAGQLHRKHRPKYELSSVSAAISGASLDATTASYAVAPLCAPDSSETAGALQASWGYAGANVLLTGTDYFAATQPTYACNSPHGLTPTAGCSWLADVYQPTVAAHNAAIFSSANVTDADTEQAATDGGVTAFTMGNSSGLAPQAGDLVTWVPGSGIVNGLPDPTTNSSLQLIATAAGHIAYVQAVDLAAGTMTIIQGDAGAPGTATILSGVPIAGTPGYGVQQAPVFLVPPSA